MQPPKQSLVFGFVVVPNFSLIALSACIDPLRIANGVLGRPTKLATARPRCWR